MQKLRKFLEPHERTRSEAGFTMMETVVSIPLILGVAGMLAYGMVQSLFVMDANNMAMAASSEIQKTMKVLESSQSCYDLQTALNDESLFLVDESEGYTISHTVSECGDGAAVTIHLEAVRTSNSRVIFETTAKSFIPGRDYEESSP